MTDLDVALRLRLVNQLSKPAEEAERDLKDLAKAAEQLGRTRSGSTLAADMDKLGRQAAEAKGKLQGVSKEADELRQSLGTVKATGLDKLGTEAKAAKQAIGSIAIEAKEVKTAVAQIGNGGFADLKNDARSAEAAIKDIGRAADQAREKIGKIRGPVISSSSVPTAAAGIVPGRMGSGLKLAAEGTLDQFGMPIPVGAGPAYAAGVAVGTGIALTGTAIYSSAVDEKRSDRLSITGGYSGMQQIQVDKLMRDVGARRGIGTQGAMDAYGSLLTGGMSREDALAMFEDVIVFAIAAESDPSSAANTTNALANNMGISAKDMPKAHDAMALGGKDGSFEPKHMAANFPSMLAAMGNVGDKGLRGVRFATAAAQSITKVSGTPAEAATRFENMINYFMTGEGITRFKEAGIDTDYIMKTAVKKGDSPVLAMLDLIKRKYGTDSKKISAIVGDSEAKAGLMAVLNDMPAIIAAMENMENADGTVKEDYKGAVSNAMSAFDRLSSLVGANIKDESDKALPYLTAGMTALADLMEAKRTAVRAAEPDEDTNLSIKELEDRIAKREEAMSAIPSWMPDFLDIEGKIQEQIDKDKNAIRKQRGEAPIPEDKPVTVKSALAIELRPIRDIGATPGTGEAPIPAVRPDDSYGPNLGRSSGPGYIPVPIEKPIPLLKTDAGQAAQESMAAYNQKLKEGGFEAEAEAMGIADRIKALLGFSVSPTISPVLVPPSPAGAPSGPGVGIGKQSSLGTTGGVKVTQNISSPNSRQAAMRAQREQNRQVRLAQARSYGDVGGRLA